jgi:hypothetical protein
MKHFKGGPQVIEVLELYSKDTSSRTGIEYNKRPYLLQRNASYNNSNILVGGFYLTVSVWVIISEHEELTKTL